MRFLRPGFIVFCVALVASLCVHLPVYTVLGALADVLLHDGKTDRAPQIVEFELAALDEGATTDKVDTSTPQPPQDPPTQQARKNRNRERAIEPPKKQAKQPEPKQQLVPTPTPPQVQPPAPAPKLENKLAVTQRSEDPEQPPPDDARFIAEENRRVVEESVASVTNLVEDAPDPSTHPSKATQDDVPGDSDEDDLAELQNVDGEDARMPNPLEAKTKPLAPSELGQGEREGQALPQPASAGASAAEREAQREVAAGAPERGGEEQTVVIEDGMGSIRIRRSAQGRGPGEKGGQARPGASTDDVFEREGSRARSGSSSPNLALSFSQFEQTFGADELRAQREAYIEQKRSRTRGGQREVEWKKFRAAIENFVTNVKPGNQTALNAAADPFAAYLANIHRNIHREYAMRYLRSLPLVSDGPYNDYAMYTRLEIVINRDGTLDRVGVVRTSGFLPFDYGAWNAVTRAAPFSQPPRKILSGDGRVYVHWDFHRNERQCGTFNAQPFILPNPPGTPAPAPSPLHHDDDDGHDRQHPHAPQGPKFGDARPGPRPAGPVLGLVNGP